MPQTHYLIVGSSHAALEALAAIRMHDTAGSITLVTRDPHLPYSPTVLPYVVSGRSAPDNILLRDAAYFAAQQVTLRRGLALTAVDTTNNTAHFADGSSIGYAKLLLATGAAPAIPPLPGLPRVKYHVLRTLDDALRLRDALGSARQAVVLGAGLVGLHAAENLAKAGIAVSVVEMQAQVLPGYFDAEAAGIIAATFIRNGVDLRLNSKVVGVIPARAPGTTDGTTAEAAAGTTTTTTATTAADAATSGALLRLADGSELHADLLLVATGVRAETGYLKDSGITCGQGILVDDTMRTSVGNVWAAGDVCQARGFFAGPQVLNSILPAAVDQGRIAGMAMAGDPALKAYPGGVPLNTYHFFGQHAISVGTAGGPQGAGEDAVEEARQADSKAGAYLRVSLRNNRLQGIFGINVPFDAGIMWQLILRQADLSAVKPEFLARPQETGRQLMSQTWR